MKLLSIPDLLDKLCDCIVEYEDELPKDVEQLLGRAYATLCILTSETEAAAFVENHRQRAQKPAVA